MIVLDFETKDPYIGLGLGAGWVYPLHVSTSTFRALGYAVLNTETGETYYRRADKQALEALLKEHNTVIMHNAQYDLGCLLSLGINIDNLTVYDTKIMAQLWDNRRLSYSLEPLSAELLPSGKQKDKDLLFRAAVDLNLVTDINPKNKTYRTQVMKWCYSNMDILHDAAYDAVSQYAIMDVVSTYGLFELFRAKVPDELSLRYSGYQKLCVKLRAKGVCIDMIRINEGIDKLSKKLAEIESSLQKTLGLGPEDNLMSSDVIARALTKLGLTLPKTATDKDSANKVWLESQDHPACKEIILYRTTRKLLNDYFIKPKEMQMYCCPEALAGERYGRLFPELNIFGADTGRCSSSNPNIMQVPKRNKEWGKLCRSIFVPDNKDNQWISADWASQESRLQIHFANLLKLPGAKILTDKFNEDPNTDIHRTVADIASIDRTKAKTINLGLSYGMGEGKLCASLGLPTVKKMVHGRMLDVAGKEARIVLDKYHTALPYLKKLAEEAKACLSRRGYIKTLGGRCLRREEPRFDYKALNKLIQGSAADQCLDALQKAVDAGLDVKFPVHDEINIEGGKSDADSLQLIMEGKDNLTVPMAVEITIGPNWGNYGIESTIDAPAGTSAR